MTKDPSFLELAGIIAYNRGDYRLALSNFLEAKNIRYAVYSAIRMGDYRTAYSLLETKGKRIEKITFGFWRVLIGLICSRRKH